MNAYETLLLEIDGPVALLTLYRPGVLNALNAAMFDEMLDAFDVVRWTAGVRVLLVTGAGEKAFAAGADINELSAIDLSANADAGAAFARRGQRAFGRLDTLADTHGIPSIALVNGYALGGGCELALACTLRLASASARFGQPEVKLGIVPGYGGTQRLPRLIGPGAALRMMLTGEPIDAAEALRIGLVEEVVAGGTAELMARGRALAATIVAVSPAAVRGVLTAVGEGMQTTLSAGLAIEATTFGELCGTADKREGTAAFLAKRKPVWG